VNRLILLDRDGTVNRPAAGDYIGDAAEVELLPPAADGIRRLQAAGFLVALVTNQRGVALGRMTAADVDAVNERLQALLADAGAAPIDGVYVCPHGFDECDCRKPQPGLLLQALAEHDGDASASFMVGDAESDIAAGRAAGVTAIRIAPVPDERADFTAPDLAAAADWILARSR
jgi:D-glycero-D-manno-heptose 1,7-bisphosphate phosphatase